jgi:hypothetical protein
MKKQFIVLLAIVMAVLCLSTAADSQTLLKRTTTKTDKFDFGAGGTISIIGAPHGSIRVVGTNRNEIEVTAEIEIQAPTEADLATIATLTTFMTDETPNRTGIVSLGTHNKGGLKKLPKKFPKALLSMPSRIDYVIHVPHYTDLEIDGGKGDLDISGVEGAMRINFLESNAKIEVIGGATTATIGTGSIDIAFGVKGWRGRAATIQIATGDLRVRLPATMSAELDAVVLRNGAIENSIADLKPRDRKVPFTDKVISAKAGVGGVPIKFSVGDGTLKMERLVLPL